MKSQTQLGVTVNLIDGHVHMNADLYRGPAQRVLKRSAKTIPMPDKLSTDFVINAQLQQLLLTLKKFGVSKTVAERALLWIPREYGYSRGVKFTWEKRRFAKTYASLREQHEIRDIRYKQGLVGHLNMPAWTADCIPTGETTDWPSFQ